MTTETIESAETDENGFLKTDAPIVDAASIEAPSSATDGATAGPKKRGRKSNAERAAMAAEQIEAGGEAPKSAGAKPKAKKAAYSQADIGAMAKQLQGIHHIAAMATGIPELIIGDQESVALSAAIVNISQQYDLEISGKTGALIQLVGTAAMIYVPRMGAISQRAKTHKAQRDANRTVAPAN